MDTFLYVISFLLLIWNFWGKIRNVKIKNSNYKSLNIFNDYRPNTKHCYKGENN